MVATLEPELTPEPEVTPEPVVTPELEVTPEPVAMPEPELMAEMVWTVVNTPEMVTTVAKDLLNLELTEMPEDTMEVVDTLVLEPVDMLVPEPVDMLADMPVMLPLLFQLE